MTDLFDNLKTDKTIEDSGDVIMKGGPLDSGLYTMAIELAYIDKSSGGATSVNFTFKGPKGETLRRTEYVTGGNAKGNKNYYEDKKGVKHYLPGFNMVNNLCLLAAAKELSAIEHEEKTIKIYSYDDKKEMPQKKVILTGLRGKEVILGVIKQTVDKKAKTDNKEWKPTGETKFENTISKVFRAKDSKTVTEIKAEVPEALFIKEWEDNYAGKVIDATEGKKGIIPITKQADGTPPQANTAGTIVGEETDSIFAD